jgi:NDP-sugar pyrophosphorylase family protein
MPHGPEKNLPSSPAADQFTAVVLAGGLGTRLRSVVTDRPKVLAVAHGRPFLLSILDQVVSAGAERILLCVGYLWEQVVEAIGDDYRGVPVLYSIEEQPRGTGGALQRAASQIITPQVVVLNGDSFFDINFPELWRRHISTGALVTIALKHVSDTSRYGAVECDASGRVLRFCEKGASCAEGWVNGGIYAIQRTFLSTLPKATALSLEREVFATWRGEGLHAVPCTGMFLDIGTPGDYARVDEFLTSVGAHHSSSS